MNYWANYFSAADIFAAIISISMLKKIEDNSKYKGYSMMGNSC